MFEVIGPKLAEVVMKDRRMRPFREEGIDGESLRCPETWMEAHAAVLEHETIAADGTSLARIYAQWPGKGPGPEGGWADWQTFAAWPCKKGGT